MKCNYDNFFKSVSVTFFWYASYIYIYACCVHVRTMSCIQCYGWRQRSPPSATSLRGQSSSPQPIKKIIGFLPNIGQVVHCMHRHTSMKMDSFDLWLMVNACLLIHAHNGFARTWSVSRFSIQSQDGQKNTTIRTWTLAGDTLASFNIIWLYVVIYLLTVYWPCIVRLINNY